MSTFLLILSIIGKILLGILLFILFLLLLILFVPIRYYAKADSSDKESFYLYANASWLMHIVHLSFLLNRPDKLEIRIFGIRINGKKEKKTKEKRKEKINESDFQNESKDTYNSDTVNTPENKDKSEESTTDNNLNLEASDLKAERIEPDSSAVNDFINNADTTDDKNDSNINSKNNEKYGKIKSYLEILKSDDFHKAFEDARTQIGKLLKIILPKKWRIDLNAGFEDPSKTGYMLALYHAFSSFYSRHIFVNGDFERVHIDLKSYFKGRITIFRVLIVGCCIFFNKKIRKVISCFKEV